jgi:hypothetical protein
MVRTPLPAMQSNMSLKRARSVTASLPFAAGS